MSGLQKYLAKKIEAASLLKEEELIYILLMDMS
jgi:hypothetical protein